MTRFHGGDVLSYKKQFQKKPLDFSVNVSPLGLPQGVKQALVDALDASAEYPDTRCRALREALAEFHKVEPDQILCGNGAADLIDRLGYVLAKKKQERNTDQGLCQKDILLTAPTFTEYRFALERAGLSCISYPLSSETGFAIQEDFPDWITPELTAVFLCEPNNPTGKTTDKKMLVRILEKCRACGVWLIIDECFQEFLDDPDSHTMQGYMDEPGSHLLILKSFTKTYAMAGIRLGYCLCGDKGFLEQMEMAAQPWAVSNLAQAAGIAALKEEDYKSRMHLLVQTERMRVLKELEKAGCRQVQGEANYLFFWHERTDLAESLAKQGILVRTCTDYEGLDAHWYRVGIRTEQENDRLIQAMQL